jgi:hypothetical protein
MNLEIHLPEHGLTERHGLCLTRNTSFLSLKFVYIRGAPLWGHSLSVRGSGLFVNCPTEKATFLEEHDILESLNYWHPAIYCIMDFTCLPNWRGVVFQGFANWIIARFDRLRTADNEGSDTYWRSGGDCELWESSGYRRQAHAWIYKEIGSEENVCEWVI